MRDKFMRFMQGRYGMDPFGRFLVMAALACAFLSMFMRNDAFYTVALLLIVYSYFRMFSRNVGKRYAENTKFLQMKERFLGRVRKQRNMMEQRRYYHIYTCPKCSQKIRIPRGKGKIEIRCPKCGETFIKKS